MNKRLLGGTVVLLLAASACGGGTSTGSPTSNVPRPSSPAKLTILEPAQGAVIAGGQVRVKLALDGARIIEQTTTQLRPDEGHVHVILDGKTVSMTYGLEQDIAVTSGRRLIQAEFVAGDHAPFDPRIVAARTVEVQ